MRQLPTDQQVKDHLILLSSFKSLMCHRLSEVESGLIEKHRSIYHFVNFSTQRFESWLRALEVEKSLSIDVDDLLPPLDVLMVWHSYCLNPRWYCEDVIRRYGSLKDLRFPLGSIASKLRLLEGLEGDDGEGDPRDLLERIRISERTFCETLAMSQTDNCLPGLRSECFKSFDPIRSFEESFELGRMFECPNCDYQIQSDWINDSETGWLDRNFRVECESCGLRVDTDSRRNYNLLSDIIRVYSFNHLKNQDLEVETGEVVDLRATIAGTVTTLTSIRDLKNLTEFNQKVIDLISKRLEITTELNDESDRQVGVSTSIQGRSKMSLINSLILKDFNDLALDSTTFSNLQERDRVLKAYENGSKFSIDLPRAVLRQFSFVEKMNELIHFKRFGLVSGGGLREDEKRVLDQVISNWISKYKRFMDLMKIYKDEFFVPTLDIDLVWHTHQLVRGIDYSVDTIEFTGRLIDHNDDVEEVKLDRSFLRTCEIYKKTFGSDYVDFVRTKKSQSRYDGMELIESEGEQLIGLNHVTSQPDQVSLRSYHIYEAVSFPVPVPVNVVMNHQL
ncbi:expressed protein [Phakopsora pachyrhizi]|uniref:Expressed protein n=1 Tax=Phakopsora pachyrhizi TaxID=170000 RepID=A0AAV0BEN3_PHAPC|nr:expressed protein [Phakopsora pachyrhizi]